MARVAIKAARIIVADARIDPQQVLTKVVDTVIVLFKF